MTKSVLVPLDGSAIAEKALATARWLADGLGVELHLVSTTTGPRMIDQQDYLERLISDLGADDVVPHIVGHRFPAPGILETLTTLPDPIVCMTTRGSSGWGTALLGSVTDEVVRGTLDPVVLVGRNVAPASAPVGPIVMGIDGSDGSLAVADVVAELSARLALVVDVVATAQTGSRTGDTRFDHAHQRIGAVIDQLETLGVHPAPHVLLGASPAELVVDFAATRAAALIAVGTHGRSGLSLRALGHVAAAIVEMSSCPVLVRRLSS